MNLDLIPNGAIKRVHVSQNDVGRTLTFELFNNSTSYTIPTGATVKIQGTKPSGFGFSEVCSVSGNTITIDTTETMTDEYGYIETELVIESSGDVLGTSNFILAVEKNPHPSNTTDGTQITAQSLQVQINQLAEIIESGGSGLTDEAKQALLNCFAHVAWIDEDGQDYYDALEDALYPPATLTSISAVYTQSGTVYDNDSLDVLKDDLVVTAHYDNGTTQTVNDYTLSGTLTVGTSAITVTYSGKTTTFNVTVTHEVASYVTDGLIARWDGIDNTANGHDSSATTWKDLVGTYDIDVPVGSATWDDDGLVFTGTQARDVKSSSVWSELTNATIEMVFTPSETASMVVGSFDMGGNGARSKTVDVYADNTIGFVGQSGTTYANSESSLMDIRQTACVYGSSGIIKALLNGTVLALGSVTHSMVHNVSYIRLGNNDAYTAYPFKGKIRAIRVYNRQLSDSELAQNLSVDRDRFSF